MTNRNAPEAFFSLPLRSEFVFVFHYSTNWVQNLTTTSKKKLFASCALNKDSAIKQRMILKESDKIEKS